MKKKEGKKKDKFLRPADSFSDSPPPIIRLYEF